jgi:hypothetical protein
MKKNRPFLLIACLYCLVITAAKGQLIFYDQITSGAGTSLNTYNGWDNNSSNCAAGGFCSGTACVQLVNTPIAAPVLYYINSTNSILTSFGTEGPGRCITPITLATSPNVYLSFLCTMTSCPDNTGNLKGDIIRLIGANNISVAGRVNATATAGKVAFRVGADANAFLGTSAAGTTFDMAGNTFLLILKFESIAGTGNDVVKLFVYPTTTPLAALPATEPTPYATTIFSAINPEPTTIKGFHINTFLSQTSSGMPLCNLGAFRVTTSWASISNSKIAAVEEAKTLTNLSVFPQPVTDKATVAFTSAVSNSGNINVLDASGRVVLTKNAVYTEGSNQITFSTENMVNGLYLVCINNGVETVMKKFIKQ